MTKRPARTTLKAARVVGPIEIKVDAPIDPKAPTIRIDGEIVKIRPS